MLRLSTVILLLGALAALGCRDRADRDSSSADAPNPFREGISLPVRDGYDDVGSPGIRTTPRSAAGPRIRLLDVAAQVGLDHVYRNGAVGENLMIEATGGGCAWLDYDGDHAWDLYLIQGGDPLNTSAPEQPSDRLFRATGKGTFEDVTEMAGIAQFGYAQGVAAGDFDNDGFDDVYVTNVGANVLYHNQGDGTFQDVTVAAGVGDTRWSTTAAWSDVDRDGDLDLYVCNYCLYDPRNPIDCQRDGQPRMCNPKVAEPVPDEFFLNNGDGTFSAALEERGLSAPPGRALGVVMADFDNDGDADVYVANDTTPNYLFVNDGQGRFSESSTLLGCAVDVNGNPEASMGVACGDYDGNGYLDLYVTHFHRESNTLYRNLGSRGFEDVTGLAGLHGPTLKYLGFGTVMTDFDLDGRQELFIVNGHIDPDKGLEGEPYQMQPQLFTFDGSRWRECGVEAGDYFSARRVGRGVATADFDDDGDLDLCVVHQNAPVALLRNDSNRGHWLKLAFLGHLSNRRGIGVRVTLRAGDRSFVKQLFGGSSYAVSHQPVLVFEIGRAHV